MNKYIFLVLFFAISVIGKSQPVITGFSPVKAMQGAVITINGSGFDANTGGNIVYFGAAKAAVNAASATQLTVTVPYGSTYAPISIINNNTHLWGVSSINFLPASKNTTTTITSSTFSVTPVTTAAGASSYDNMLLTDFNQDGKVDIISTIASGLDAIICCWKNTSTTGTISFSNVQQLTIPIGSTYKLKGIAVGDLNADGYMDIIETHCPSSTSYISYFLNNGASASASSSDQFSSISTITIAASGFWSNEIAIADFNKDGLNDIVVGGNGSSSFYGMVILKNTSSSPNTPSFSELPKVTGRNDFRSLLLGDIDVDGILDITSIGYYSSGKSVDAFRNQSTVSSFNFSNSSGGYNTANLTSGCLADINSDGKLDVVECGISGEFYIHENTSSVGSISLASSGVSISRSSTATIYNIDSGDLNGDGKPDIVFTNYTSSTPAISIYQNAGNSGTITSSSLSSEINISIGSSNGQSVRIADFDNDGNNDFVVLNTSSSTGIRVYRNLSNGTSMPVSWLTFTGKQVHGNVQLNWSTASELINSHYEIQRSNDAINFSSVGRVNAAINPDVTNYYQYLDYYPLPGVSFYRLKQFDLDGKFSYSSVIQINGVDAKEFNAFVNVASGTLQVRIPQSASSVCLLYLYDASGRLIAKRQVLTGRNDIDFSQSDSGMYFVQVVSGNSVVYSTKVVK